MNNYSLRPKAGSLKQEFFLEDENGNVVYEAKMIKFKLFKASPFEFVNHITNKKEEHNIGKTITIETESNVGLISTVSRKSYFKYDGVKIWDYLKDKGIRIDSHLSENKIGMTHKVFFEDRELAIISTSSPKGKSIITTSSYYDVVCKEEDLDIVFLVAFSIIRTGQLTYN